MLGGFRAVHNVDNGNELRKGAGVPIFTKPPCPFPHGFPVQIEKFAGIIREDLSFVGFRYEKDLGHFEPDVGRLRRKRRGVDRA